MRHTLFMSVTAFALGVGVTVPSMILAQAKPPAYALGLINVGDEDGYKNKFLPEAQKLIKEHGGIYVAGGFGKTTRLDGEEPPNRVVLIRFENDDAIKKWWEGGGKKLQDEQASKYSEFKGLWAIQGVEAK